MKLTQEVVKKHAKHFDTNSVFVLNLSNTGISSLGSSLEQCAALVHLSLSNNNLTSLTGFPSLPNLRRLDLSENKLSDIGKSFFIHFSIDFNNFILFFFALSFASLVHMVVLNTVNAKL